MATMTPVMIQAMTAAASGASMIASRNAQSKAGSAAQQRYNSQMQQMKMKQDAQERKRKEDLKKQSASQRARFAGLGIGAGGGSSDAVLEGLTKRSNAAGAEQAKISNLGLESLRAQAKTNLMSQNSKIFQDNMSVLIGKK